MSQYVSNNSDSYQQQFQAGLSALQQKNWDIAIKEFQSALDQGPATNAITPDQAGVIYHNMSLAAKQKGDLLKSYIWARKSVALAPNFKASKENLASLKSKIEQPLVTHDISTYENLQKLGLDYVSYDLLALFTIISALISLYQFFKFILNKKAISQSEDGSIKNLKTAAPWIGIIFALFFALFLTLANLRWSDLHTTKGIISIALANLQTAPGKNQAVILQLKAATEVQVLGYSNENNETYVQVRYPGAFSGWIKKSDLVVLTEIP